MEADQNADPEAADTAEREKIEEIFLKEDETDNHSAWLEVRQELIRRILRYKGLLMLLASRMSDGQLILEGPNAIVTNMIERDMGREITDTLQQLGISSFSFGIQSPEIQREKEEKRQQREQHS